MSLSLEIVKALKKARESLAQQGEARLNTLSVNAIVRKRVDNTEALNADYIKRYQECFDQECSCNVYIPFIVSYRVRFDEQRFQVLEGDH